MKGARIAFYAPMKAPDHATPSGDREMARNLMAALRATGAEVDLVSDLRVYDGAGNSARQAELIAAAQPEIERLRKAFDGARPDIWVSYHSYYKAPDLLGPAVSRALNMPYVQIESSRAKKRLTGPWARFAEAAEAASDAADLVFYMTALDRETLERDRPEGQRLAHLPPFLPLSALPPPARPSAPVLLATGMMRAGDKLASYRLIADTLSLLIDLPWRLEIAGDGVARDEVETLMAPFADRVHFLGRLDAAGMARAYGAASVFFWPGVNEAYGMVYLEAQAAGLPVVAQDRPGVRDVLAPGDYPAPESGSAAMAAQIRALLENDDRRVERAAQARAHIAASHLLPAARDRLAKALSEVTS